MEKRELGQYPAILTSGLVSNPYFQNISILGDPAGAASLGNVNMG